MTARSRYQPSGRTEVRRLRSQLEDLFLRVEQVDAASEIAGDLHRYLCVRVSGFLEQSLISSARACCGQMSSGRALEFASSWLERSPNPRAMEVVKFIGRFDSDWADELASYLEVDERGGRVNALLGIRNDVAHGKNQGVSRRQAWDYFELVCELTDWILDRLDPLPASRAGRQRV